MVSFGHSFLFLTLSTMADNDIYSQMEEDNDLTIGYGTPPPGSYVGPPVQMQIQPAAPRVGANVARLLSRAPQPVREQAAEAPVDESGEFDQRKFVKVASARLKLCIQQSQRVYENSRDGRFGRESYIDLTNPNIEFVPDNFIGQEYPIILQRVLDNLSDPTGSRSVDGLRQSIFDAVVVRMNQSMGLFSGGKGLRYYIARWDKDTKRNSFMCMAEKGFKDWLSSYTVMVPCKKKKSGDIVQAISLYDIFHTHANKRQFLYTTFDPRWNYEVSLNSSDS